METYYNSVLISLVSVAIVILFRWKVWPLVREWLIQHKAYNLVLLMEESMGGGTGEVKYDTAVELLQEYVLAKGWKVDVNLIYDYVTAAVGKLHAAQGEKPPVLEQMDDETAVDEATDE